MMSVYAHRGSANSTTRENTVKAFALAAALGADGVELDVRRTLDGSLVVHHDIDVEGVGAIPRCRLSDLPEWIPSLEESLLACADAGLEVNVEVKSEEEGEGHDPSERCAVETAVLCDAASLRAPVVVSSFSRSALAAAREASSCLRLAWLVDSELRGPASFRLEALRSIALEGVHPFSEIVDAELVTSAHDDGLAVRVWTVDDPARIVALARLGVEAIITNDVEVARRSLATL